jgi:hypothetical protein
MWEGIKIEGKSRREKGKEKERERERACERGKLKTKGPRKHFDTN